MALIDELEKYYADNLLKYKPTKSILGTLLISPDKKTIVLLNHDKLWKVNNFKSNNFFKGDIKEIKFEHNSQKEGICFKNNSTVYISDERGNNNASYIYAIDINKND